MISTQTPGVLKLIYRKSGAGMLHGLHKIKYLFSADGVAGITGLRMKLLSITRLLQLGLIILNSQPLLDVLVLQSWTVKFM